MKRRDLIDTIKNEAKGAGLEFAKVREGSEHEIWGIGDKNVTIPRHSEINEITAQNILKRYDAEFGKGWWRK